MYGRLKLFGTIQVEEAATNSPDPLLQNVCFDVFNREFNDPKLIPCIGRHDLHDLDYISLPVSSTSIFLIAAKLYLTSDRVDDTTNLGDDYDRKPPAVTPADESMVWAFNSWFIQECVDNGAEGVDNGAECVDNGTECVDNGAEHVDNEAFHCCDDCGLINFLEFSDKPNGGSGSCKLQGKHGSLELYYVAVRYAVDADLEVKCCLNSKETKVTGYVLAHYGEDFDYADPYTPWQIMLFEPTSASVIPGNLNLMGSVLAVPAKSSLIIKARLYDSTSNNLILCDAWEFHVPRDCRSSYGEILGPGGSSKLKVNWKQPCEELKIPSSSNSSVSHLTERRTFGAHSTPTTADPDNERRTFGAHSTPTTADPDKRNRWSLQEEIAKVFNTVLKQTFKIQEIQEIQEAVPCSISTCTKEDGGDYLCSGVLHKWPEIKNTRLYKGPKHAGLAVRDNIMGSDYKDMMERCVVCGPGFVKFKLRRAWIAKSIHTMLTVGIDTWAPKLSVKKASILYLFQNIAAEMGHLRPTFIGETLARMLEYSGVAVVRKRIHNNVDFLAIKDKSFCESYTRNILDLFREKGLPIGSEGDELPVVYLTEVGSDFYVEGADLVVHVSDLGQRESIRLLEFYENVCTPQEQHNRLTNHTLSFDQMLNEEGNTVVYLHYTHARICSVIRNSNKDIKELTAESLILKHDDECELGLHLLRFTEVLGEVCRILICVITFMAYARTLTV